MQVRSGVIAVLLFVFGVSVGYAAKRLAPVDYRSASKEQASAALLQRALGLADGGSWERIAVGRVYYLSGRKAEGQVIFDEYMGGPEPNNGDLFRIARVYREAGEWAKAKAAFDRGLQAHPRDERGLAEAGANHLLNGDRAAAEALFDRAFKEKPDFWVTVTTAGAYAGVAPHE